MGYLVAGHVLVSEPDVTKLAGIAKGVHWALYKAKRRPVWMLDTFTAPPENHFPFGEYIWRGKTKELDDVVPNYSAVMSVLSSCKISMSITVWVQTALEVSRIIGQRVFTFLSDDDILQMTVSCDAGRLQRLHCDYELVDMVFADGRYTFTPTLSEEDPDIVPDQRLLDKLRGLPSVELREATTTPGGGRPIHDIVMNDWPEGAGNPQELVRMGSGEDFQDFESDFDLVASDFGGAPAKATSGPIKPNPAQKNSAGQEKRKSFWKRFFRA